MYKTKKTLLILTVTSLSFLHIPLQSFSHNLEDAIKEMIRDIRNIEDRIACMFETTKTDSSCPPTKQQSLKYSPGKTHVERTDEKVILTVELPGFKENEVKVSINEELYKKYLVITAEQEEEEKKTAKTEEGKERTYSYRSMRGNVYHRYLLNSDVDEKKVKAVFEDGLLTVEIPYKKESAKEDTKIREIPLKTVKKSK